MAWHVANIVTQARYADDNGDIKVWEWSRSPGCPGDKSYRPALGFPIDEAL